MVPKAREKRVLAVLSCNFRFPSLYLVRGFSFIGFPGHKGSSEFQGLSLPDLFGFSASLSRSKFRHAVIRVLSVLSIMEARRLAPP